MGKFEKETRYEVPFEDRALAMTLIKSIQSHQIALNSMELKAKRKIELIQNCFDELFSLCGNAGTIQIGNLTFNITCTNQSGLYIEDTNALEIKCGTE